MGVVDGAADWQQVGDGRSCMDDVDEEKIDELTLALLYLGTDAVTDRAWKSFDWDAMDRLHRKGLISDPRNKNKCGIERDEGRHCLRNILKSIVSSKSPSPI